MRACKSGFKFWREAIHPCPFELLVATAAAVKPALYLRMKFKFWSPALSFRDDLEAGTARKLWHPKAPDPGRSEPALLLICHPG
jgi:hypothetical protein